MGRRKINFRKFKCELEGTKINTEVKLVFSVYLLHIIWNCTLFFVSIGDEEYSVVIWADIWKRQYSYWSELHSPPFT